MIQYKGRVKLEERRELKKTDLPGEPGTRSHPARYRTKLKKIGRLKIVLKRVKRGDHVHLCL